MSSLVGMAGKTIHKNRNLSIFVFFFLLLGTTMTQIGVGIGVSKSSTARSPDKSNHATDSIKPVNHDSPNKLQRKKMTKQLSNNSAEPRHTNDGCDDENSNSFESHSDADLSNISEKKFHFSKEKNAMKNRHGLSVNWGTSKSTTAINLTSTRNPYYDGQFNQKTSSNVRSFAHTLYRSPIRLTGFSSAMKAKGKQLTNSPQLPTNLTPIPSESELTLGRIYPPPQPRPESLAIMSEELFHEKLKARQSPLFSAIELSRKSSLCVNNHLSANCSSTSSIVLEKSSTEDVTHTNEILTEENLMQINSVSPIPQSQLTVEPVVNHIDESSDDSWRLLNSTSSLDIPYIDESDFEDLGKIFFYKSYQEIDDE